MDLLMNSDRPQILARSSCDSNDRLKTPLALRGRLKTLAAVADRDLWLRLRAESLPEYCVGGLTFSLDVC